MPRPVFESLPPRPEATDREMLDRARAYREELQRRRTVRSFSPRPVPRAVITECIRCAATAPSGANMQPWHFVAVSDPAVKRRIRAAAEAEERSFYAERAPEEWLRALEPLGTDADKPFLEVAPWLIAVFVQRHGVDAKGRPFKHYYATESVGLATGLLIAACHRSGLATLTHTPSPMDFLNEILGRPDSERPFLLLVVGHPAADVRVPVLDRKGLDEVMTFVPADAGGEETL